MGMAYRSCCVGFCRRQREIVTPTLFDAAVSGNGELFFKILENGDDVNPMVSNDVIMMS